MPCNSFKIDLHVHTAKYSACAEILHPEKIEQYALQAGLDAVVLTDHDHMWSHAEFQALQEKSTKIQFFNGIEFTDSHSHHFVAIGMHEQGILHRGVDAAEAIDYVHQNKGIVILAHPFRNGLPALRIIEMVDAMEIGSTSLNSREAELAKNLSQVLQKPGVASSDAHALERIGWAYTDFSEKPSDIGHLCSLIREGHGHAILPHPFFE